MSLIDTQSHLTYGHILNKTFSAKQVFTSSLLFTSYIQYPPVLN